VVEVFVVVGGWHGPDLIAGSGKVKTGRGRPERTGSILLTPRYNGLIVEGWQRVTLFLGPTKDDGVPFQAQPKDYDLSRVPCLGEVIGLGNDKEGISADYRVVLVYHRVIPQGAVVEVYAVRVDITNEIQAVKPKGKWKNPLKADDDE
jgi:hypothetical protein